MLLTYMLRKKELHKYKLVSATSRFGAAGCAHNEPNYKYTIFHDYSSFCMASEPVYGHRRTASWQDNVLKASRTAAILFLQKLHLFQERWVPNVFNFALLWYWLNLVPNILSKSAWFCICCELVRKKGTLFCPSFQRKHYQLTESHFQEVKVLAAG